MAIEAPSKSFGRVNPEILAAENGLGRSGIDDRDELDRYLIVAAREHERARICKPDNGIVGTDLADGIDRALPADNLHVEVGFLVIALLNGNEEIGVPAVVSEVGYQGDIVERLRVVDHQEHSKERQYSASCRTQSKSAA